MSSLESILSTSATGLSAESIRMNTISSNLANANSVGSSPETTYHKKFPVFSEITQAVNGIDGNDQPNGGVKVTQISHSTKPLEQHYDPTNPSANQDGFVYQTDVNPIAEMTEMISASKEYQANVETMNTAKGLIMQTINVLKD